MDLKLDVSRAGEAKVRFSIREAILLGIVELETLIRSVTFYILLVDTLFLLSLKDLNKSKTQFDNLANVLI